MPPPAASPTAAAALLQAKRASLESELRRKGSVIGALRLSLGPREVPCAHATRHGGRPRLQGRKPARNSIVALGSPLLDVSMHSDLDTLAEFGLQESGAVLANTRHEALFFKARELKDELEYSAGGAALNVVRVAQWMLGVERNPGATAFVGCVGADDEEGWRLQADIQNSGVRSLLIKVPGVSSGQCLVLLTRTLEPDGSTVHNDRSLVTRLGASASLRPEHLQESDVQAAIREARVCYAEGYMLSVSPQAVLNLARQCSTELVFSCSFALNVSATRIVADHMEHLQALLPYVDILFMNEHEAVAWHSSALASSSTSAADGAAPDIGVIALRTAMLPKHSGLRSRTVVVTCGARPVVVAHQGIVYEFPVPLVDPEMVVDKNAAGDSFVGGFLAQLVQWDSLEQPACAACSGEAMLVDCVRGGLAAAKRVVQIHGCSSLGVCNFQSHFP